MGATLALAALTGLSGAAKAYGDSQSQRYAAAAAERDAMVAKTQAAQTDTQLREELNRTLSRVSTIRASSNVGLDSPTTGAVLDEQRRIADRERQIRVGSLDMQAAAKRDEADFRRASANMTLYGGGLDAVTGMAKIGYGGMKPSGSS